MYCYRQARMNEIEALLELIEVGFAHTKAEPDQNLGREHRLLFDYLYQQPEWQPKQVVVAEQGGELLAAVGFFPQCLELDGIYLKAGAISPVVTAPEARGQGLARNCLLTVEADLRQQGFPLAFLWGLPDYYPRLGYVPLLPRYKTKLFRAEGISFALSKNVTLREVRDEDRLQVAALYQADPVRWLKPLRNQAWWEARFAEFDQPYALEREYPFMQRKNFLVGEKQGKVIGYLYLLREPNFKRVMVMESAGVDLESALDLVKRLLVEQIPPTWTVYFRGTSEHLLNHAAELLGGIHLKPAPLAGMIKVLDWQQFLEKVWYLLQRRVTSEWSMNLGEEFFEIYAETGRLVLKVFFTNELSKQALTRLIFGLYDESDLEILNLNPVDALWLFSKREPFIWDQNYLY